MIVDRNSPEDNKRLSMLSPDRRARLLRILSLGGELKDHAIRALHFITDSDTGALAEKAHTFSAQCAAILNQHSNSLRLLDNSLKDAQDEEPKSYMKDYPARIISFLKRFCDIDETTGRACAMDPQAALHRLREDPISPVNYYERFCTHSYPAHCMLDLVALDNSLHLIHTVTLLTEEEENYRLSRDGAKKWLAITIRAGLLAARSTRSIRRTRYRNYSTFADTLSSHMDGLRSQAEEILSVYTEKQKHTPLQSCERM